MRMLINTTTFPNYPQSPVPRFVLEQILHIHKIDPTIEIDVLIPQHSYDKELPKYRVFESHREIRYHYFWPWRFEKLTGRGIMPALKENPIRVALIPFHLFFQYLELRKICKRDKPDIVYAHWFMTPAAVSYFVCKKLGIPLMFTTHASDVSVLKKIPFAKRLISRVLNYAKLFTAVSLRTEEKLKSFFSSDEWEKNYQDKIHILPMGTQLSQERPDPDRTSELLSDVGLDTSKHFILALGRLTHKKGLEYLIEAYSQLTQEQQSRYQLVLAGDGQLDQELKNQANKQDHFGEIVFPGYVHGELKQALLSKCTLFVLPSIIDQQGDSEGLPVALMEAMANGRVVIATNVSGAEEVITDEMGFIVPQKSSEQLSKALHKGLSLSDSESSQMQLKSRELSSQFDWPNIAEKHIELLRIAANKQ